MTWIGIRVDRNADIIGRRKLREANIACKVKQICPSDTRRFKALSSTGYRSEADAAQWLVSHLDDPFLDEPFHREFSLFLCVHSELANHVQDFWDERCFDEGWNHAHEFPPHITLLSNLRVPDDKVLLLHDIYDKILCQDSNLLEFDQIPLKLVTSDDFIGYIVSSGKVNSCLTNLCQRFLQELLKNGIILEDDPMWRCKSNYHMSLAYGFQSANHNNLGELQDSYNLRSQISISWTLDLFSADPRLSTPDSELYEMHTTIEVDDVLFSNLFLEYNIHTDSPPSHMIPSSPEIGQPVSEDHLFSSTSSSGEGQNLDSANLQSSFHTVLERKPSLSGDSRSPNTLAHSVGDKILLIGSCNLNGHHGVPVGLNLDSGLTGVFSLASARRIPKWHAWVSHRSTVVIGCADDSLPVNYCSTFVAPSKIPMSLFPSMSCGEQLTDVACTSSMAVGLGGVSASNTNASGFRSKFLSGSFRHKSLSSSSSSGFQTSLTAESKSDPKTPSPPSVISSSFPSISFFGSRFFGNLLSGASGNALLSQPQRPHRRLFVMRHGERVDSCFGRAWTTRCIDRRGLYRRLNLNMPARLPVREDIIDHTLDSPLTEVGLFVASACGRALAESGIHFTVCYTSPAFRCVQTACQLLKSAGQGTLAVRIEPLLFEWLGWYSGKLPNFLSSTLLHEMGYNVDQSYKALSSADQFNMQETVSQYYARSAQLVKNILDHTPARNATILIVGHAASLDSCTRGLLRRRPRDSGNSTANGGNSNHGNGAAVASINGVGTATATNNSNGGGMGHIEELHRRCSSVPYCGLLYAVEGGRRWHLEEPPIPPLTHGRNAEFDWRQFNGSSICNFGVR